MKESTLDRDAVSYFMQFITDPVIPRGSYLSFEDVQFLSQFKSKEKLLFEKTTKQTRGDIHSTIEFFCADCNLLYPKDATKTEILNYISSINKSIWLCKECEEDRKENRRKKQEKREEDERRDKEETLTTILDPLSYWRDHVKKRERFQLVRNLLLYNKDFSYRALKTIKSMGYQDFLQTPYWKAISYEVKRRSNFRCSLCGENTNLNTHHTTYKILGKELEHMDDLVCVCFTCHSKIHAEESKNDKSSVS